MSVVTNDRPLPRPALLGAAVLVGLTLIGATTAKLSGLGAMRLPADQPVQVRDLRFEDRIDGAVTVTDAASGRLVKVFAPGTNGFVRGVMRGLARDRRRNELAAAPPFRLVRTVEEHLMLEDPMTGRRVDLGSFGPTNAAVFARLLDPEGAAS